MGIRGKYQRTMDKVLRKITQKALNVTRITQDKSEINAAEKKKM